MMMPDDDNDDDDDDDDDNDDDYDDDDGDDYYIIAITTTTTTTQPYTTRSSITETTYPLPGTSASDDELTLGAKQKTRLLPTPNYSTSILLIY